MAEFTKDELLENKTNYKNIIKQQGKEVPISEEEVTSFFESLNNLPEKDKIEIEKALDGDFGNYNNLNKYYRNCLAVKAVLDMEKEIGLQNMNFDNPNFVQYLKNNQMNCALHKGISLLKNEKPYLSGVGESFSRMLLENTLQLPTKENEERVLKELGEAGGRELLQKNLEKQKIMAKTLFMAQIGKYSLKLKNSENPVEFDGFLSETIVHGGRTNIILPYGGDQERVMASIYGITPEETAELKSRSAATHYATRQKMNDDGTVKSKSAEESPWSVTLHKVLPNQFGMNIAVGGIGETGPDKKMILPTGSAGHMYVRKEIGNENACGSLLVGFESADPGATSFTGHKHDFRAVSAQQSAFLADKSLVGKKTDGRTIDLSGLEPEKFEKIMNEFDRVYSGLQKNKDFKQLEKFNNLLTGKRLDEKTLMQSLSELSFNKDVLEETILPARLGIEARVNIPESKIIVPGQSELSNWKNKLDMLAGELKIDFNNQKDMKKLFAVEKVDGKMVSRPLFNEMQDTAKDYYKRMNSVILNGGKIFAFRNGESEAQKVSFENGNFKLESAKSNVEEPTKPSFAKRFLNAITFGMAYENEISKYKTDLKNYNKEKQIEQIVVLTEEGRKADAEKEVVNNNRIPLDSEKLKKDLGMERTNQRQKSQPASQVDKSLKNDKSISN